MAQNSPPRHPSTSEPVPAGESPPHAEELEPAEATQEFAEPGEDPDPYDDLWDPDMDTRPERIRKTKARLRTDSRTRGGPPPRGKRREGV